MAELLWLRLLRKKLGSLFGGSLDPSKLRDCVPSCVWAWAARVERKTTRQDKIWLVADRMSFPPI